MAERSGVLDADSPLAPFPSPPPEVEIAGTAEEAPAAAGFGLSGGLLPAGRDALIDSDGW